MNNIANNQDMYGLMEFLSNENGIYFIKVIDMDAVDALIDRALCILLINYWCLKSARRVCLLMRKTLKIFQHG